MIGKLEARTVEATNRRAVGLIRAAPRPTHTVRPTTEPSSHGYKTIEAATRFYLATPYHSWERGTSENTNGLIRQYLPKRKSHWAVVARYSRFPLRVAAFRRSSREIIDDERRNCRAISRTPQPRA